MRGYLLRRGAQAVLVLWAAYTLTFLLLSAMPGDAVSNRIAQPDSQISPEAGEMLLAYYGLDRPVWEQYLHGLGNALRGDLGLSLSTGKEVTTMVGDALPSTLQLAGLGLGFALVIAALLAVVINYAPWRWLRSAAGALPGLFGSVPTFVVGIVALQYLSFRWNLIPAVDNGTFLALVAPALTLGLVVAAPLSQVFASSIRSTRAMPFVHVMHAKGAREGYIFRKGVLRNSSLPVLTLLGLATGELIAGSVVTEAVFARSGIGQVTVSAVSTQDLPVVQGIVVLSTVAYVVVNLAVDLAYPFLDPRIIATPSARTPRVRRRGTAPVVIGAGVAGVTESPRRTRPIEVAMP